MKYTVQEVEAYLHEHIPITRHLGVRVLEYDDRIVRLTAPLSNNINHRDTAFGGSISALAILSGWTYVHLQLHAMQIETQLVIQKSQMSFVSPVDADFEAVCHAPPQETWSRFIRMLTKHKKARIRMNSMIRTEKGKLCTHEGEYVAMIKTST